MVDTIGLMQELGEALGIPYSKQSNIISSSTWNDYLEKVKQQQQWIEDLHSNMYVNCVYCGYRYGPSDRVPTSMAQVLREHVEECPKHPMSQMKQALEKALPMVKLYAATSGNKSDADVQIIIERALGDE